MYSDCNHLFDLVTTNDSHLHQDKSKIFERVLIMMKLFLVGADSSKLTLHNEPLVKQNLFKALLTDGLLLKNLCHFNQL